MKSMLLWIKATRTTKGSTKPNRPRANGKHGNTQVNKGSKNVSLRHQIFNGLWKEMYLLRNVKLNSESAELTCDDLCRRLTGVIASQHKLTCNDLRSGFRADKASSTSSFLCLLKRIITTVAHKCHDKRFWKQHKCRGKRLVKHHGKSLVKHHGKGLVNDHDKSLAAEVSSLA